MNPTRLLAVTESLVETKDTAGRYRLPKQNLLPRFGSPKNPFAEPATETPAPVPVQTTSGVKPAGSVEAAVSSRAPKVEPKPRAIGAAWIGRWRRTFEVWVAAVLRFRVRWPQRQGRKAGAPRKVGLPIQTELSLENVKVVRNDLRESDLEVVPLRSSAPRNAVETPVLGAAKPAPTEAWTRLTARFRRTGQMQAH